MTMLAPETKAAGPCLAHLQSVIEAKQSDVEWLVITHNDPMMIRRLSAVIDENSSAVLQMPQSNWDLDGFALPEAVKWSIAEAGVKHLLLLGHSMGATSETAGLPAAAGPQATAVSKDTQSSYSRLLEGARGVQMEISHSKAHFADQVAHLCEIEEVQDAIADGRLHLHCLFYVAQSGTFLLFDIVQQQFQALDD